MEIHSDKCEVLHLGRSNQGRAYTVNAGVLGSVVGQRTRCTGISFIDSGGVQVVRVVKNAFGLLALYQLGY